MGGSNFVYNIPPFLLCSDKTRFSTLETLILLAESALLFLEIPNEPKSSEILPKPRKCTTLLNVHYLKKIIKTESILPYIFFIRQHRLS